MTPSVRAGVSLGTALLLAATLLNDLDGRLADASVASITIGSLVAAGRLVTVSTRGCHIEPGASATAAVLVATLLTAAVSSTW